MWACQKGKTRNDCTMIVVRYFTIKILNSFCIELKTKLFTVQNKINLQLKLRQNCDKLIVKVEIK